MRLFVPHVGDDPEAARAEWDRCRERSGAPLDSRPVYSVTHVHEGARYVVTVGQRRAKYARKTGPRGGYIAKAGYHETPVEVGTIVSAIVDTGSKLDVWSYDAAVDRRLREEPPIEGVRGGHRGWANPSYIGYPEIVSLQDFDAPPT